MTDASSNLIDDDASIGEMLRDTKTIAVLGIKPSSKSNQPAHYVPKYMASVGYDVIPVPVYYPEVEEILGKPVHRSLTAIDGSIDLVNVFRKSEDIPQHVDDIIRVKPKYVWFQLGIRNDGAAKALAEAGIKVVQDRCIMVEHRHV